MLDSTFSQASGLRRLFGPRRIDVLPMVFASREPGAHCEQSWSAATELARFAARYASALVRRGRHPVLIDGDRCLMAPAVGLRARFDLHQLLSGDVPSDEVVLDSNAGFCVVPAARGMRSLAERPALSDLDGLAELLAVIHDPRRRAFDTALLCSDVTTLLGLIADSTAGATVLCVCEPSSRTLAYRAIKQLAFAGVVGGVRMVYHQAGSRESALAYHADFAAVVQRFLGIELQFAGLTSAPDELAQATQTWNCIKVAERSAPDPQRIVERRPAPSRLKETL